MLTDYHRMSMSSLIDLLALHTEKYTQLLAEKEFTEEYLKIKETIQQLQAVIEARKNADSSTSDVRFTPPDSTL